jgi:peroxiredoxin Q/BCP
MNISMKKIFLLLVLVKISVYAPPLQIGGDAPLFVLKDQEGFTHNLVSHRGSFVLLFFFSRDYTFASQRKVQKIEKMIKDSLNEKLIVYGISTDTVKEQRAFYDKMHISFDLLSDINGSVIGSYNAKSFLGTKPFIILIGPDGRIFRTFDNMQKFLDSKGLITSIIKGSL